AKLLGPINSIRVTAYRIALTAPGVLAVAGQYYGWPHAFAIAAIAAVVVLCSVALQRDDGGLKPAATHLDFLHAFKHWLLRPQAGVLLAIAFTYRLGELTIVSMIKPYWVDRGFSPAEIGTITSIVGVVVSILGAILGGALLPKLGIYRGLLVLGIAQCASNIGYAVVSMIHAGRWSIYAAAIVENLGYGLGTAAFLAFLMSICDRERAATEYALLTAAYGFTGTIMASASGWLVKAMGYSGFFWLTVFLGLPALVLIPLVREQIAAAEAEH
ncbi:MAG TPA: MFS transporter, partial [Thermoanaerobaculia bacterium]|nr:MFS transporter [Thermoanaerobaculia bacterium]